MARETGSYRQGFFATVANAAGVTGLTGLGLFATAMDTRLDALGTTATSASGTFTMNVTAEDAGSDTYTFKFSVTFNTGTGAAGSALTAIKAILVALDALADATEGASTYTTVTVVDVTATLTMNN